MYRNPTSFAIDPSGDMFKCLEHLGNSEYKVGNIKEKSVSLSEEPAPEGARLIALGGLLPAGRILPAKR